MGSDPAGRSSREGRVKTVRGKSAGATLLPSTRSGTRFDERPATLAVLKGKEGKHGKKTRRRTGHDFSPRATERHAALYLAALSLRPSGCCLTDVYLPASGVRRRLPAGHDRAGRGRCGARDESANLSKSLTASTLPCNGLAVDHLRFSPVTLGTDARSRPFHRAAASSMCS